ncbi:MAG TPA: hypothetical protein VE008_07200 [Burkholderiales bacterium]|nr:hypothetical protein [Burkholderiales bacterium]
MITNAERHQQQERKGEWRTATAIKRCSRYFGDLACCERLIQPGRRYFDTNETVPDAGARHPFVVCANCGNAAHSADFLSNRSTEAA